MTVALEGMLKRIRKSVSRSALARSAVAALRRRRARAVIRSSGRFDEHWYREQLSPPSVARGDLLDHYLSTGSVAGLSPSPLFDPTWYLAQHKGSDQGGRDPFAHYLVAGLEDGSSPHPFFDAAWYSSQHPEARGHRLGPLGHYLEVAATTQVGFHPDVDVAAYRAAHPEAAGSLLEHAAREAGRLLSQTRGYRDVPRLRPDFDHPAAERFKASVLTDAAERGGEPPLVTVVLPTKDRAQGVVEAVRSVLAQTYRQLQLVVVDDGSTDGTVEALRPLLGDPRVELVRRERPGGVSVARNAGLARARGSYVAYLDSDNTWKPEFLEVMVAFVTTRGIRVGYAASELVGETRRAYRCTPFDAGALRERNYIDCIVLLHERALLDEVGGFDESLRRMVDWDLMIRMAAVTDFELAPFIATTYDLWEDRDDRLSLSEPFGYRDVIRTKRLLDWDEAERGLSGRDAGLVSLVVHARGGAALVERCVQGLVERSTGRFEVVVVDGGSTPDRALPFQLLALRYPHVPVRVLRFADELTFELGNNLGVAASCGAIVVVVSCDVMVEPGWLDPLVAPLVAGSAVATQPVVLRPSGVVLNAGLAFSARAHPHGLLEDVAWHAREVQQTTDVPALSSLCIATRADAFVRSRGFDPMLVEAVDSGDLSMRLRRDSGLPLRVVPDSVVVRRTARAKGKSLPPTELDNRRYFEGKWRGRIDTSAEDAWRRVGHEVVGWRMAEAVGAAGHLPSFRPVVVLDRPTGLTRWAIKTPVPDVGDRQGWGDYYFAVALRDALLRQGQEAVVDCEGAWYRGTAHHDDVVVVLRGRTRYAPNPQHVNLMWLISHPDTLRPVELDDYDHVLVASAEFADRLAVGRPGKVETMFQCTDQNLFAPVPDEPPSSEVLFVGNSRGILRPAVRDGLAAGLDLVLYGNGWDPFVPPDRVRATYVPNHELARTYARAGVVLNDHWDDMRDKGFMSNRLFDLAACGARVVTDRVSGLSQVFGDVVLTFDSPDSLKDAVSTQLADGPERAAARDRLSVLVRREHTFDARARRLVELVSELSS